MRYLWKCLLFRIIGRISENTRIYSPCNAISESDDDAMFICMHELIIKQELPDGMHQLSPAVR